MNDLMFYNIKLIKNKKMLFIFASICFVILILCTNNTVYGKNNIIINENIQITNLKSKNIVVKSQKELNSALKSKYIKKITIRTNKKLILTIRKGTYNKVDLVIDAPNIKVNNNAKFKKITINKYSLKNYWNENSSGNSYDINIAKQNRKEYYFIINNRKNIKSISIKNGIKLKILGTGKIKNFVIKKSAKDLKVSTNVAMNIMAKSNCTIILNKNAEKSTIKAEKDIQVKLVNKTNTKVTIIYIDNNEEVVQEPNTEVEDNNSNEENFDSNNSSGGSVSVPNDSNTNKPVNGNNNGNGSSTNESDDSITEDDKDNNKYWSLEIIDIKVQDTLKTIKDSTDYDGTITQKEYIDKAKDEYMFVMCDIEINKILPSSTKFSLNNIKLSIGEKLIDRISEDSFLQNHNMNPVGYSELSIGGKKGTIIFEVPKSTLPDNYKEMGLYCDGIVGKWKEKENHNGKSEVEKEYSLIEQQKSREKEILSDYSAIGKSTINDPYIVLNPYDIAPLTALAIFETEQPKDIIVKVVGKDDNSTISYTINNNGTSHQEILIFGLYADYLNEVIISDGNISKRIYIQTEAIPTYINSTISAVKIDTENIRQDGLISLATGYRKVIDLNGEIRWYSTINTYSTINNDPCQIDAYSDDGSFWCSTRSYEATSEIFNIAWSGKILRHYIYYGINSHHDGEILPNGHFLYISDQSKVYDINLETGKNQQLLDLKDYLDYTLGSQEVRSKGDIGDWAHFNSIYYDDGNLYFSLRNQHMVIKMDYVTKEIKWVFTSAVKKENDQVVPMQSNITQYLVLPEGDINKFDWFYSQHDVTLLPDLDQNGDTDDILIYDNGDSRSLEDKWEIADKYSRIVHYRVDSNTKKVEKIFSAGESIGIFSGIYGSAQYLNNGNYIYCNGVGRYYNAESNIIEVDNNGKIIEQFNLNEKAYRAYKFTVDKFIAHPISLSNESAHINYSGYLWKEYNNSLDESENISYSINKISKQENYLTIGGWIFINNMQKYIPEVYLVASNEKELYYQKIEGDFIDNKIPEEFREPDSNYSGFYSKIISLYDLPDGIYDLGLYIKQGNEEGYISIPYYLNNGDITSQESELDEQQSTIINGILTEVPYRSIEDPIVIQNPFEKAPLTALVGFSTADESKITVKILGKDGANDYTYEISEVGKNHIIPIYGLYYNYNNTVVITAISNGNIQETTLNLKTDGNIDGLPIINVEKDINENNITNGFTFMVSQDSMLPFAIDKDGEIRWYYTDSIGTVGFKEMKNGHFLIGSTQEGNSLLSTMSVYEIDLLGRIYTEYYTEGGIHHEAEEGYNGNLIFAISKFGSNTINDCIVEMAPATGETVRSWDMAEIMGGVLEPNSVWPTGLANSSNWFHNNSVELINENGKDYVLVSSRHQSLVIKFEADNPDNIVWVIGDHDQVPEKLQPYLLKPIGEGFEWQYAQHAPLQLSNGDIMLFDNGCYRSKNETNAVSPSDNYSRAVIYHIDQEAMTIEQIWQYGKELGNTIYATYVGDVDELDENHYLINFGGICKDENGNATDDITGSIRQSHIVEIKNNNIVWQVDISSNDKSNTGSIYRVEKINKSIFNRDDYTQYNKIVIVNAN